eukprot:evm.model.scf_1154EXC.1 EVM.evm.TU.scf_1154EXC.1   scf_1154EXC:4363-16719(-)
MLGQKRTLPASQDGADASAKRRNVGPAGPAAVPNPSVVASEGQQAGSTDFAAWDVEEIKAFLDQRGEDYDRCLGKNSLVALAHVCEFNTGPPNRLQGQRANAVEDEVDPLDAFMAEIDEEMKASKPAAAVPDDDLACDEEDHVADFLEARKLKGATAAAAAAAFAGDADNSDDEVYATAKAVDDGAEMQYDSDDNPIMKKKTIESLPPLDHAEIDYEEFAKDFYEEVPEIAAKSQEQVNFMRNTLGVRVSGFDPPKPVSRFEQCGFDTRLLAVIKKQGFERPTPIQAQSLPAVLSGRDVLGIAKTGSGKTAAFVLPMLLHVMDQPELGKGEGPIAVIVAPTRELAEQIHKQARIFSKPYGLVVCAAFGGLSKYEQFKNLKSGSEVVVCTPGRIIDLIKMKACTMRRTTYLVLDEADRMFDMGFEPQVRSIIGQIRPDRQTLLFSATMPASIERLSRDILTSPIRITAGAIGAANEDIRQVVSVLKDDAAKQQWLLQQLPGFVDSGEVLIFAGTKARVEELVPMLKQAGFRAAAIHGDMDQFSRMEVLHAYRQGNHHVLVATDVASRGLDIRSIKNVVNFDCAKDIDAHIHRIGRTGRAGDKDGTAHTLLTEKESRFAGQLLLSLTTANQDVPRALHELAMKDGKFRKRHQRNKGGRGRGGGRRRAQVGGAGLGFKSQSKKKPMAGFAPSSDASEGGCLEAFTPQATTAGAQEATPSTSSMVDGTSVLRSYHTGRFRSAFVSSGSQGGDAHTSATVIAPKQAPARAVPPPPTPVTEVPMVTTPQPRTNPQPRSSYPSAPSSTSNAASQAFVAAQAIAARLAAKASGGTPSGGPAGAVAQPQDTGASAISAAQAISARLVRQGEVPQAAEGLGGGNDQGAIGQRERGSTRWERPSRWGERG